MRLPGGRIEIALENLLLLADSRTARVLVTVLLFALGLGFLYVARATLIAFLFAIFFAYLMSPLVNRLEKFLRGRGAGHRRHLQSAAGPGRGVLRGGGPEGDPRRRAARTVPARPSHPTQLRPTRRATRQRTRLEPAPRPIWCSRSWPATATKSRNWRSALDCASPMSPSRPGCFSSCRCCPSSF